MKGHYSISIPTKKYIKAYVESLLGNVIVMRRDNNITNKLYDLLQHKTNEHASQISTDRFTSFIKIYVPYSIFRRRGCNLNATNVKNFNRFIEHEVKSRFYFLMDFHCSILPSFEANLPAVRKLLGIDEDSWDSDSMKKSYYRYRKQKNKALFYNKTFA